MSARRLTLGAAATLAGAAGLGLEDVLLQTAGLALGHARAAALGLGVFVAGWAIGAWAAGRSRRSPRPLLPLAGLAVLVASALTPTAVLAVTARAPGGLLAGATALAALFVAAVPQGAFLPWLVRARGHDEVGIAGLYAWNLLGSVVGVFAIGYLAVGAWGRPAAALVAGALALLAGLLAWGAVPRELGESEGRVEHESVPPPGRYGLALGLATLWIIGLEWVGLRLGVLWIGSEQLALTSVLAGSLAALSLGAAVLPRLVHRDARGPLEVLVLAGLASTWPLWAAPALDAVIASDLGPALVRLTGWERVLEPVLALVLVGPMLLPLGGVVPVLWRTLPGEGGRRLGGLLLHEAWGACAAGPLVLWWLVPSFGLGGTIGALTIGGALAAFALRRDAGSLAWAAAPLVLIAGAVAWRAPEPALSSPKLVDPALTVRAFTEDEQFAVTVVDDGLLGERTLLTDRFRAAGTGRDYRYMRALGHLPLLLHPAPRTVAVAALGTGTTVGAVSLHGPEVVGEIDVLEISRSVVDLAPWFVNVNLGALDPARESRVRVLVGDARRTLAAHPGRYDVITVEPLLPDSPFGVYLYTPGFYDVARSALAEGGLVCQWVPPHALEPVVFDAVLEAFCASFDWSGVWLFGSQVILVGASAEPELVPERFPSPLSEDGAAQQLASALAELGLADPTAVFARYLSAGSEWPSVGRALTDADPWVAYRDKPRGAAALTWMPLNLERVRARAVEPPASWEAALPAGSGRRLAALRELPAARIALARGELDLVTRVRVEHEVANDVRRALAPLLAGAADDPEVRELAAGVEFLASLRRGVAALAGGDARGAAGDLVRAAELRPERADTHLYLAAALAHLGVDDGARKAAARAVELCPRVVETPPGRRVLALGLDPALLAAGD